MVHPVWPVKLVMGTAHTKMGKVDDEKIYGEVTENLLLRLPFHDCIPYGDGSGKFLCIEVIVINEFI